MFELDEYLKNHGNFEDKGKEARPGPHAPSFEERCGEIGPSSLPHRSETGLYLGSRNLSFLEAACKGVSSRFFLGIPDHKERTCYG